MVILYILQLSLIKSISFHLCDFSQSASDDLLIDTYIKWQYTHGIMFLYLSTCAELVESTLGHSRENINLKTGNNFPSCLFSSSQPGLVLPWGQCDPPGPSLRRR